MAKFIIKIDKERCKGCNLCVVVCPKEILKPTKELNSKGLHFIKCEDPENCTGCKQCTDICPDTAIEIDLED